MSSPDRMEQLASAIRIALESAEESNRRWEQYDADMLEYERRIEEHDWMFEVREGTLHALVQTIGEQDRRHREQEERYREQEQRYREQEQRYREQEQRHRERMESFQDRMRVHEQEFRAIWERSKEHERRYRELRAESRRNDQRTKDSLTLLTQVQAEIARLDAAS